MAIIAVELLQIVRIWVYTILWYYYCLKNQVTFLKEYANAKGIIVDETFEDIGSGLNYNRKRWNKLL